MPRKLSLLSLAMVGLSACWYPKHAAASPPPGSSAPSGLYNVEATFCPDPTLACGLVTDNGGPYFGGQQGVKCGIDYQSHDFLFNPQDYHYSPPRNAWANLSGAAPNPCTVSLLSSQPTFSTPQGIQYMIVRQVDTIQSTGYRNAHIVLPNGTLRFGYGGCAPPVQVTLTGTNPNQWTVSTQGPGIGELVQSIKGTTQVVGYYYVPFQIQITGP
jgi:hypothetical protein